MIEGNVIIISLILFICFEAIIIFKKLTGDELDWFIFFNLVNIYFSGVLGYVIYKNPKLMFLIMVGLICIVGIKIISWKIYKKVNNIR